MINYKQAMNIIEKKQKASYPKIKELLKAASSYYYETEELLMSDLEYDELYKKYKTLTGEEIIGSTPKKGLVAVNHSYNNLVGTLEKAKDLSEVEPFLERFFKTKLKSYNVRLSLKFDGNSITIERDSEGNVIQALTRGSNGKGKSLTNLFKDFKLSPLDFYDCGYAIKYEAIISYENYDKLCNEEDYANPRSLISGILGRDDSEKYKDYITLIPLELRLEEDNGALVFNDGVKELFEDEIEEFYPNNYYSKHSIVFSVKTKEELKKKIKSYYDYVNSIRTELPFMIDGIVVDMLDEEIIKNNFYNPSGFIPLHSFAIKLPYLEAVSEVEDILYTVGNSGRITPNVIFKPVKFNGTTHTKQSIANYKRFKELNLGKGSKILVSYHNDVLTYITKLNSPENENITPFEYTKTCPLCGEPIEISKNDKDEETLTFCSNLNCPSKILGKIENYFIKMDIKGIKINTIEKLYEENLITDIQSVYNIDMKKTKECLGPKNAINFINAIKEKEYFDYEILGSLNIPNISIESAKLICSEYSLEEIMDMEEKEMYKKFINVEGFSKIKTQSLIDGIYDNVETIYFLMERGCKVLKDILKDKCSSEDSLRIVFTGFRNNDWEMKLKMQGHKVTSSVSKKTNLVVYGDEPGNVKIQKAKEYGIKTMYIEEFKKEFNL